MENALLYRLIQNGCDRNQTNTKKYRKIRSFTSETITSCSPFAFFRIPKYNIWRVTLRNYDIPFFPTTSHYTRISYSRDSFYHVGDHGIGRIITFDRESITSAWDRATFCPTQTQYLPSGSAWWLWSAQRQAALEDSLIKLDRRDGQSTSRFPRFSRCYYEICREPRETRLAEPTATTAREREKERKREANPMLAGAESCNRVYARAFRLRPWEPVHGFVTPATSFVRRFSLVRCASVLSFCSSACSLFFLFFATHPRWSPATFHVATRTITSSAVGEIRLLSILARILEMTDSRQTSERTEA